MHIPEEYDYRYSSLEKRDKILESVANAYVQGNKDRLLAFYFKVRIDSSMLLNFNSLMSFEYIGRPKLDSIYNN